MKYNININQFAAQKHFKSLDVIDIALLDYLIGFSHNANKLTDNEGIWFWVAPQKIIDDMPILGLKSKRSVQARFKKLLNVEIIKRHQDSQQLNRSYFMFTNKLDKYLFTTASKELQGCEEKSTPTHNDAQGCAQPYVGPTHNDAHDNIIKDNIIIDSSLKENNKINKEDDPLYILFNSLFKNKYGLDFQPTKARNKTYHINALKKLNEIHGEDLPGFLEACLNIKNTFLQKYLNPAEILDKHSDFVINLNQQGAMPKAPEKSQPPKIKVNKPKRGPDYQELAVEGYKKFMKMYKDYTRQEYIARVYAPFDTIKIIKEMYLKRVDPLKFLDECFNHASQTERPLIEPGYLKDNPKEYEDLLQKCLIK